MNCTKCKYKKRIEALEQYVEKQKQAEIDRLEYEIKEAKWRLGIMNGDKSEIEKCCYTENRRGK